MGSRACGATVTGERTTGVTYNELILNGVTGDGATGNGVIGTTVTGFSKSKGSGISRGTMGAKRVWMGTQEVARGLRLSTVLTWF